MKKIEKFFTIHDNEYLEFDKIPENERRNPHPDLCAMIYLHEKLGGTGDAIVSIADNKVWLAWENLDKLTEEDVIYILRCGVGYDSEFDSLNIIV